MPSTIKKITIDENELNFSFSRSSGPGGQNVNKVNSRVTMRWVPSESECISNAVYERFLKAFSHRITLNDEVVIHSDRFRDQKRNMADCREKLHEMLQKVASPPKKRIATKPSKAAKKRRLDSKKAAGEKKKTRQKVTSW